MFTLGSVAIRPLETADFELLFRWHLDNEIEVLSGWGPRLSRETFDQKWSARIREPRDDLLFFGILSEGALVGRIELALIDRANRNAAAGLFVGERTAWGKGIGSAALRLLLDYAFKVENLERVWAHVFSFNPRAMRLMERVGFVKEGVLRQHEAHNGALHDMHAFGILKAEFYRKFPTVFPIPAQ
ncbi:MAG: GNAT family N-acetyltransferase [Planctomycetes bacterium]|nr:GNAT family N-acetyltransferase [Planctomycetota bacterium]